MSRQGGICQDGLQGAEFAGEHYLVIQPMQAVVTGSADIDTTLKLFLVIAASESLATMELTRNQVVEGEIPFTGTKFTYTRSESLGHRIRLVEITPGS